MTKVVRWRQANRVRPDHRRPLRAGKLIAPNRRGDALAESRRARGIFRDRACARLRKTTRRTIWNPVESAETVGRSKSNAPRLKAFSRACPQMVRRIRGRESNPLKLVRCQCWQRGLPMLAASHCSPRARNPPSAREFSPLPSAMPNTRTLARHTHSTATLKTLVTIDPKRKAAFDRAIATMRAT